MIRRILIAEDNDSVAAALEPLLQRKGLRTERARDGVEAMSRIAAAPPDVLLLDLKMPKLHGIELLKKLRQSPRTKTLPVVVMTGVYREERHAKAAQALGITAYLEKPFKISELLEAIGRALPDRTGLMSAPQTLDQHLLKAFKSRFSGQLIFKTDTGDKTLALLNGTPTSLRPGFAHLDFGDYLRRKSLVSDEEYSYYAAEGDFRPETLVKMGCLEYPDLLQEKLEYLTGELIMAFRLGPLTAVAQPCQVPAACQGLALNLPQLLYKGFVKTQGNAIGKHLLEENLNHYAGLTKNYYNYINFFQLSEEETLILRRMDGSSTLLECLQWKTDRLPLVQTLHALEMLRFSTAPFAQAAEPGFPLRTLFNSLAEDTVQLNEEPLESFADLISEASQQTSIPLAAVKAPPVEPEPDSEGETIRQTLRSLKGKNYYQIFGLDPGKFSFDLLKKHYFEFTRQYGPDTMMRLSGVEASMVQDILSTVTTAYNTLSDVVKKERYDELLGADKVGLGQAGDDRFQAQVQAQSGKVFLEMGEWENAEKALQDACNIETGNGDYLAHLAWAIYRNPKNAHSQAVLEKARQMLNSALTLERTADGFAFKGWMLLEAGKETLAEGEFNKALKLDARSMMARKGLRQIIEQREQQKKGLFRRMFG